MARYFFKVIPLFIVGSICFLALPWLGLIALFVVAALVVPAIAFVVVYLPYKLGRVISHVWQDHGAASPRPAHATHLAGGVNR